MTDNNDSSINIDSLGEAEATKELSKEIRAINADSVHRICSGQVIISLALAVKELIENALDAAATNIDIRLKNSGLDTITVADNGHGIESKNFQSLTLKYYTSKIESFEDLSSVKTFGFRGEALSSLCALANVIITTRHRLSKYATKIRYDKNGVVLFEEKCARQIGTTVELVGLFKSLPVRHKEFQRNIRREFSKLCSMVYAYALISKNVKINFSNEVKNKLNCITTTTGHCVRENIAAIFGIKQIEHLLEIENCEINETVFEEYGLKLTDKSVVNIELNGFVSSSQQGSGRSSSDRQFIYVNNRPIDHQKISKLINQIYRQFNTFQYPFVCLNIQTATDNVDVNLTPDKRMVLFQKEKLILAVLKSTLLSLFRKELGVLKVNQYLTNTPTKRKNEVDSDHEKDSERDFNLSDVRSKDCKVREMAVGNDSINFLSSFNISNQKKLCLDSPVKRSQVWSNFIKRNRTTDSIRSPNLSEKSDGDSNSDNDDENVDSHLSSTPNYVISEVISAKIPIIDEKKPKVVIESKNPSPVSKNIAVVSNRSDKDSIENEDNSSSIEVIGNRKRVSFKISLDTIKTIRSQKETHEKEFPVVMQKIKFRSKLSKKENETAQEEFERQITKSSFAAMNIIGQFNYGFIITKLDDDLFIIDQHSSDEKFNYETLRNTTNMTIQPLIVPQKLNLTIDKKQILLDNLELFQKLGFVFETKDKNSNDESQIALKAIPISKNIEFTKEDIDEMLFILEETSITKCEPSKMHAMFASRACRKSVMVGKALNLPEMRKIINHMGEIEHPWNCPHGRPTIRHLMNLKLINLND